MKKYKGKSKEYFQSVFAKSDWRSEDLTYMLDLIEHYGREYMQMDFYPNQYEIVTSEQLLDVYSSIGLPVNYGHWSFGKDYITNNHQYKAGQQNLSYELVINSNPCISYNLESNTTMMQTLVAAHAAVGHNYFFKNNYMFKEWTDADNIIQYMSYARNYILKCEDTFGMDEVEKVLDAAHALKDYGVDRYKRVKKSLKKDTERFEKIFDSDFTDITGIPKIDKNGFEYRDDKELVTPEENILYFIEKNAPKLPVWKREIIRIVRKVAQYFTVQGQTKVANEMCLEYNSLIPTQDGLKEIGWIVENKYSGKVWDGSKWETIYDWFTHTNKKRIKLTLSNNIIIHGGYNHKILTGINEFTLEEEWTEISKYNIGDYIWYHEQTFENDSYIKSKDFGNLTIINIEEDFGTTYDFSVSNSHRYYHNGMIHHNCATFTHLHIINKMYDDGYFNEGFMLEFYKSHSGVIFQPSYKYKTTMMNPYALGLNILTGVKDHCVNPTKESKEFYGKIPGDTWLDSIKYVCENFRDDSLILQYLSPKIIRDMGLFMIHDDAKSPNYSVDAIHNEYGYDTIRKRLSENYNVLNRLPNIQVKGCDRFNDKTLYLKYFPYRNRELNLQYKADTLRCIEYLWESPVVLE